MMTSRPCTGTQLMQVMTVLEVAVENILICLTWIRIVYALLVRPVQESNNVDLLYVALSTLEYFDAFLA